MYKGQGGRVVKLFKKQICKSKYNAEHCPRESLLLVITSNVVACAIYLITSKFFPLLTNILWYDIIFETMVHYFNPNDLIIVRSSQNYCQIIHQCNKLDYGTVHLKVPHGLISGDRFKSFHWSWVEKLYLNMGGVVKKQQDTEVLWPSCSADPCLPFSLVFELQACADRSTPLTAETLGNAGSVCKKKLVQFEGILRNQQETVCSLHLSSGLLYLSLSICVLDVASACTE